MNHTHATALLAVLPGVASPRARRFAREVATREPSPRGMGFTNSWRGIADDSIAESLASFAAGMGGLVAQRDASDKEKNEISRRALAAQDGDRGSYVAAVHALAQVRPWGPSGPNWYTTVANGGWYAYSDVATMLSTTVAERHPDWLTAVGTAVGTGADLEFGGGAVGASLGSPTAVDVDAISSDVVNAGGSVLTRTGDVLSGGAVGAKKAACDAIPGATWDDASKTCSTPSLKWWLLGGAALLLVIGGGAVYLHGRGMRRSNPRKRSTGRYPPTVPPSARRARRLGRAS